MRGKLSPKQEIALGSLLTGATREAAAMAAGVTPSTLYRWLASDALFRTMLERRQTEMFDRAVAALYALSAKAVRALDRNLVCGHGPTETRAALGILAQAVRVRENEIRNRLERLEDLLRENHYDFSEFETVHQQAGSENGWPF